MGIYMYDYRNINIKILPIIPNTLNKFEYANVSIPIAILIWLMIYPMMVSVDFKA